MTVALTHIFRNELAMVVFIKYVFVFSILSMFSACASVDRVRNPIIPGFNPDPSIVRVGDDFYLISSSFQYFPGLPVYHSKDMVNWELISYAMNRRSQLDLIGVDSGRGLFAPTIRHNNGVFYIVNTLVPGGAGNQKIGPSGNFVVTANDPRGPWSDPIWIKDAPGIDPDLLFDDDGRVYFSANGHPPEEEKFNARHRIIWTQEIDLDTFQLTGERMIFDPMPHYQSGVLGALNNMEAPHLFKVDGYYYLLVAHGGTGLNHAVSVFRSLSISGPWENNPGNPIVTNRDVVDAEICCAGHADLVDDQNGNWWSVMLAIRSPSRDSPMGRETFLAPVVWRNAWPIVNEGKDVTRISPFMSLPKGAAKQKNKNFDFFSDFDHPKLNLAWNTIRTPPEVLWWQVEQKQNALRINLRPEKLDNHVHPSFLGVRIPSKSVDISALLDFHPSSKNEVAGIALERGHKAEWTVVKEKVGGDLMVAAYKDGALLGRKALTSEAPLEIKISLRYPVMTFLFKELGGSWQQIMQTRTNLLGNPPTGAGGRFTGAYAGVYASSQGSQSNNSALYHWFRMTEVHPISNSASSESKP